MKSFESKKSESLRILRAAGIRPSNYLPPLTKILWILGIEVPPPHFMPFGQISLLFGAFFALVWGGAMYLLTPTSMATSLKSASVLASISVGAGIFFGLGMAWYYTYSSRKHRLPSWKSLDEFEDAPPISPTPVEAQQKAEGIDDAAESAAAPSTGIILGILFYPLGYFVYYRNWILSGKTREARLQIAALAINCFFISGYLTYESPIWAAASIIYWLAWAVWSYRSTRKFQATGTRKGAKKSTRYEIAQFIVFSIFYIIASIALLSAHEAWKTEQEEASLPYNIKVARANNDFLVEISGVWEIPATNESFEIHFEDGRKWIKKGAESSWVNIEKTSPEDGYVVFSIEGSSQKMHTIKKIINEKNGSFNLVLVPSGQGSLHMSWIRKNI